MTVSRLIVTGILLLASSSVPLAVHAQQAKAFRVGVILQGGPYAPAVDGLRAGLKELGREEGQPGGRLTGIHSQFADLTAKRLELLKEMIPGFRRAVTFYNPDNPSAQQSVKIAREAARRLHVTLVEWPVGSVEALRAGLRALRPGEADALFFVSDAMVSSQADLIVDIARANRLPTMLQFEEQARRASGALASYGVSFHTIGRLSAKQVHRILQGANPGDLPPEQLDKFYLVVNRRTAKPLGLTIPPSVLARADELVDCACSAIARHRRWSSRSEAVLRVADWEN